MLIRVLCCARACLLCPLLQVHSWGLRAGCFHTCLCFLLLLQLLPLILATPHNWQATLALARKVARHCERIHRLSWFVQWTHCTCAHWHQGRGTVAALQTEF